ncbi:hypothetical protein PAMP_004195 [Pampus punctatissimus]
MGMSKPSQEPEVVLGYKECGHTDASQRSPFIEEKGSTEPKGADLAFFYVPSLHLSCSSACLHSAQEILITSRSTAVLWSDEDKEGERATGASAPDSFERCTQNMEEKHSGYKSSK